MVLSRVVALCGVSMLLWAPVMAEPTVTSKMLLENDRVAVIEVVMNAGSTMTPPRSDALLVEVVSGRIHVETPEERRTVTTAQFTSLPPDTPTTITNPHNRQANKVRLIWLKDTSKPAIPAPRTIP